MAQWDSHYGGSPSSLGLEFPLLKAKEASRIQCSLSRAKENIWSFQRIINVQPQRAFHWLGGKGSNMHSVGAKMTGLEAGKEKFKSRLPRLPAGHPSQSPGLSEPQCSPLEMARPTERLEVSSRPVDARSSAPCQVQSRHWRE